MENDLQRQVIQKIIFELKVEARYSKNHLWSESGSSQCRDIADFCMEIIVDFCFFCTTHCAVVRTVHTVSLSNLYVDWSWGLIFTRYLLNSHLLLTSRPESSYSEKWKVRTCNFCNFRTDLWEGVIADWSITK